jgi:hypothetical protein
MLPPRGANDYTQSANDRYRVLAPVAVYPLKTVATVGMQRTGYVHVTGVPIDNRWFHQIESVDDDGNPVTVNVPFSVEEIMKRVNAKLCDIWDHMGWAPQEIVGVGVFRFATEFNGWRYESSGGLTGVTEPAWPAELDATVLDGTATWTCRRCVRRKWGGIASAIPANARNRLLTDRQITVTWTAFKNVLQNLIEQRQLADGDLD